MNQFIAQKVLVPVAVLICSLSSCNSDNASVNRAADKIEGAYELTRITWEGDALDINGDGVASNDLYGELLSLPINAENDHRALVQGLMKDRTVGFVRMQLPTQNVNVTEDGRYPTAWMIGSRIDVSLYYQIDPEGHLAIDHFDSIAVNEDDARIEMKSMNNGTAWFNEKGDLCFEVTYTFYDYIKAQLVEGIIRYSFEKIDS